MTLRTIQVATSFGCLDVDAIADGTQFGALQARTLARQANRLLKKRQQILNLMWPITTTTIDDYAQYANEFLATERAYQVLAPMPMLKKPGIVGATVYLRVRASSGATLNMRAATLAVDRVGQQEASITGTGSWQWVSIPVVLDHGWQERLTLSIRAEGAVGALMDTSTWGSPNSGAVNDTDFLSVDYFEEHSSPTPSWDPELVGEGHTIVFSIDGEVIAEQRLTSIIDYGSHHGLTFDPLATDDWQQLVLVKHISGRITYEIRTLPWLALAQVLVVTDERSL